MGRVVNELRHNNTSGLPCMRLCERVTRTGLRRLWIDVTWWADGVRRATSYPASRGPVAAVSLAMQTRTRMAGVEFNITPRQAWNRLKKAVR